MGKDPRDAAIDLVIADKAESSVIISVGVQHVFVNGKAVVANGAITNERPGRALRGPGYRGKGIPASARVTAYQSSLRMKTQGIGRPVINNASPRPTSPNPFAR